MGRKKIKEKVYKNVNFGNFKRWAEMKVHLIRKEDHSGNLLRKMSGAGLPLSYG